MSITRRLNNDLYSIPPERKSTFNQPKEGIEARETAMGTHKNDKDAGRPA